MILEPLIYGQSIGVSEVALLIMMAFWTWMWGAIGLILAAPLTVCIVVISKSIPGLEFVSLLMDDKPALEPDQAFYQRLIARNPDEANGLIKAFRKKHSKVEYYEQLLLPALSLARQDGDAGRLSEKDQQYVFESIRGFIEDARDKTERSTAVISRRPVLAGCPVKDEADALALTMLADLLRDENWDLRVLHANQLTSEYISDIEQLQPPVICLSYVTGGGEFPLHQYCKRLRLKFAEPTIIAARWSHPEREKAQNELIDVVDLTGLTLTEVKSQIIQCATAARDPNSDSGQEEVLESASVSGDHRRRFS